MCDMHFFLVLNLVVLKWGNKLIGNLVGLRRGIKWQTGSLFIIFFKVLCDTEPDD